MGTRWAARATLAGSCCAFFLALLTPSIAAATSRDFAVLEQGYATTLPADAYGDESTSLHVGTAGSQPTYRSYVLLDTGGQTAATVAAATLTLTPDTSSSQGTVNAAAAAIWACPLATKLAQPFNASAVPADACTQAHAAGRTLSNGDWTFDLLPLMRWWDEHGSNTGIAVVPDPGSTDPWTVTFTQGPTHATAATLPPAAAGSGVGTTGPASSSGAMPASGQAPPPAAPTLPSSTTTMTGSVPAAVPQVAPSATNQQPQTVPTAATTGSHSGGVPVWSLALAFVAGGILIGAAVMGREQRRRLATAWAAMAPDVGNAKTPIRLAVPPTVPLLGGRSIDSGRLINGAVVIGLTALAWATAAARLPHGAPSGVMLLGLVVGSLNGLLAVGLVLIYRATRIINFAQGALGAFSAVLAFELMKVAHWPWAVAVPLSVVAAIGLSAALEFAILRRLRTAPRTIVTVATIGIAQLLTFLQLVLQPLFEHSSSTGVSAVAAHFPSPFSARVFTLFPVLFRGDHVVILVAVPLVLVVLHRFLTKSWIGMGIRGVSENAERASMLGWPAPRLATIVWGVAGLLSALAALLQAPVTSFAVTGSAGPGLILRGLAAAAIGRMTSIPVTFAASIGLGVVEQLVFFNYSRTAPMDGLLLGLILVAFLLQARTLGRATWQDASSWRAVRDVRPVPFELRDLPVVRAARTVGPGVLIAIALAVPAALTLDKVRLLAVIYVYAIVGVSLVVLTGWAGQISLGQWAVAGVGAFTTGWLMNHSSFDFVVSLVLGGLASAVVCVLLGLPALRIRGIFAGITTLAFAIAAGEWFFTFGSFDPGRLVPRPHSRWFSLTSERSYYYVVLAALVIALLMSRNLRNSRVGRLLIATRDNEQQAASFGVSVVVAKLSAFAVAGFIAGLGGGVYALLVQRAEPMDFPALNSLFVFAIVVIGGLGSITGAVLGAFYVQGSQYLLPGWASFLATGVGIVLLLLAAPGGLAQIGYDRRDAALAWLARRSRQVAQLEPDHAT